MPTDATDFDYDSITVPPGVLFVAADEPLLVYPSIVAAERHLEAEDVKNGVYPAAYGANGKPYRVRYSGNTVRIESIIGQDKPDELRLLLLRYLAETGCTTDVNATLEDLAAMVWGIESDFWRTHDPYGERFGKRIPKWGCLGFLVLVAVVLYLALG